jgi:hypothetical protein
MQMRKRYRAFRFGLLILLAAFFASPLHSRAQSQNQAGLVIEFGDGSLYTGCTGFEAEGISGYDLLASSGLSLETAFDPSQGVAVCKIGSDGCPADDCFCQMPEYWSYWNWLDGSWSYAGSGSSTNQVGNGDVDGWSWGTGSPPPAVPFSQLCAPPATPPPTETAAPSPTQSPEPQPSDTPEPEPTDTFLPPTNTNVPSQAPLRDTPTPSAKSTITSTPKPTQTLQATQQAAEVLPNPTRLPSEEVNIHVPAPTRTEIPPMTHTPEAREEAKNEGKSTVGYAVFGALLVGLGLTLARIILKGHRP